MTLEQDGRLILVDNRGGRLYETICKAAKGRSAEIREIMEQFLADLFAFDFALQGPHENVTLGDFEETVRFYIRYALAHEQNVYVFSKRWFKVTNDNTVSFNPCDPPVLATQSVIVGTQYFRKAMRNEVTALIERSFKAIPICPLVSRDYCRDVRSEMFLSEHDYFL